MVYAGAIMVLFLFVIMLLNLRGNEDMGAQAPAVSQFTKLVFGILLTLELTFIVKAAPFSGSLTGIVGAESDSFGSVKAVAEMMFTDYLYPFELTGVLLLVAVVGAVVIARKRRLIETGDSSSAPRNDAEVKE